MRALQRQAQFGVVGGIEIARAEAVEPVTSAAVRRTGPACQLPSVRILVTIPAGIVRRVKHHVGSGPFLRP